MKKTPAQEFINIEMLAEDILVSKDGYIFGFLYVKGRNIKLLSEQERQTYYDAITYSLESIKEPWQILSIPRPVNVSGMLDELFRLRKQTANDAKLRLIDGEISSVNELARSGAKEPIIVLKLWEKASKNAISTLKTRLANIKTSLELNKVTAQLCNKADITFILKMFSDLTVHSHSGDDISESDYIPTIKGKPKIKSEIDSLIDLITPINGYNFGMNKITIGNVLGRVYGVVRYPSELQPDWLTPIMNNTSAITSVYFNNASSGELAEALSKSIRQSTIEASSERDYRRSKQLMKNADDADDLLAQIDEQHSSIGFSTILTMPFSADESEFEGVCRDVMSEFSKCRIKLRALGSVQKAAYMSMSPFYTPQPIIDHITQHIMPLHTLAAGSPMNVNIYRDTIGYYFGRTEDGGIVSIDLLHRGQDRTNSNIIALGSPGGGKSTALKHIIQTQYMRGVKILIIDPEREFIDLCHAMGGTVIHAGGEHNTVINPLHIRNAPTDEDGELAAVSALAQHLRTLGVFWDLYLKDLTQLQRAELDKAVLQLYNQRGIEWDTDVRTVDTFPTMKELFNLLTENQETTLAAMLNCAANGADSFVFNGQTNVDLSNDFIVFDTSSLDGSNEIIKRTQYFNVLSLCWDAMSADRVTPVLLVCDEAYLLIDEKAPQAVVYLRNISKRCRKYEGSLAIAIHSVVDLLGSNMRTYAQALIDNATYKILFSTDGKNLKETAELYDLTESEQDLLLSAQRGSALFMMGNSRFKINFVLPPYKLDLMGKAGGR